MRRKPNVLILFSDQQRYDTVGRAGYPHMITPNLDRLCSEGCTYVNAHSTNPVCMPARHDLMTGLPARAHGYFTNAERPIRDYGLPTLARLFSENGYRTAAIGKCHHYPVRMHHGFSEIHLMEELPEHRQDDQYAMYLQDKRLGHLQNIHGVRPHIYHIPQTSQMDEKHHGSTWVASRTIEWLEENGDNPFFAFVGWIHPHPPWDIPENCQGLYADRDMPDPIPISRTYPDPNEPSEWFGDTDSAELKRKTREAYYTAVTLVDKNIGRILDHLEARGVLDDTLVIFTSEDGKNRFEAQHTTKEGLRMSLSRKTLLVSAIMLVATTLASSPHLCQVQAETWEMGQLVEELISGDYERGSKAADTLASMGDTAVPVLAAIIDEHANDPEWLPRWFAVRTLGDIRGDAAAMGIVAALDDTSADVRKAAADALYKVVTGGSTALLKEIVSSLKQALTTERDTAVAVAVVDALRAIGQDAKDAVPELVLAFGEGEVKLRWAATRALTRIDPEADHREVLASLLLDGDRDIHTRLRAAAVLQVLGVDEQTEATIVSALSQIVTDETAEMNTRLLVAERLGEMVNGNTKVDEALAALEAVDYVEVYPGPGEDAYKSDLYKVEVYDGAKWVESYTYKVSRKSVTLWHRGGYPSVNFTTFGTTGDTSVRVTRIGESVHSVDISPKSKSIEAAVMDGKAVFVLRPNYKAWVTINGDDANPLFVFADSPRPVVPAGAIYFGPGIHDIGQLYPTADGQVIYIDGGAWVKGNIDVRGRDGVTIMGRGVLSGEKWKGEDIRNWDFSKSQDYFMVLGDAQTRRSRVEGITIVNSPKYCSFQVQHFYSVKLLSPWYWSTDGFYAHPRPDEDAEVDECFAFVGDDVFFPRDNIKGNILIQNSFVGCTNNNVFDMSYWAWDLNHGNTTIVRNIDIKTYNEHAIFQAVVDGGEADVDKGTKNQVFEDINIEGDINCPLIWVQNRAYPWGDGSGPHNGNTYNIVFRNITLQGTQRGKSKILGKDEDNGHHDYLIENLMIGGVYVTESNKEQYFDINEHTSNLRFAAPAAR